MDKQTKKLVRDLEEAVIDAWPARETEDLDGWLLRASGGPTHRGNSVATLEAGTTLPLPARIERAEAWYAERDLVPMFQVGPCAAPAELDRALAERGYRTEGEAVAALAAPSGVLERTQGPLVARVEAKPSAAWLEIAVRSSRFAATHDVFMGFLARLGSRCRFALAHDTEGRPAATCMGITSEDRLGIYAMFALPHIRRQGTARALLRALAEDAVGEGMRELYLLAESDNLPARTLYAHCGFQDLYMYHYRVRDDGRRGVPMC